MTAGASNINLSSQTTGSATLNGQLTGTNGLLLKTPAGAGATFTLTLANTLNPSNNYSGNTTTSTRTTIALAAVTQIPNGSGKGNVVNNGTLTLGGLSHTINGLSGSGTIDGVSGTPTLTIGDNNATGSFSGVIKNTAGTLSVAKIGTGSITLTGVNTYSGATSISAGSIIVPKINGASTGTATFTNTTLSISFDVAPTVGMTFRYFPGTTTQTYASVTLIGAPGRTGVYTSANSTLTIA
jgi:autotransporter-associated beta strand protein